MNPRPPEPDGSQAPQPPYYAVVFSSQRSEGDQGYAAMAERMEELARQQPGFLGLESARGADGFGITVSYWSSEDAIVAWKAHLEHQTAQTLGRERWYTHYSLRVARVERAYGFLSGQGICGAEGIEAKPAATAATADCAVLPTSPG